MSVLLKDPEAVLDYSVDWSADYLQVDELIATSAWAVDPAGELTVDDESDADGVTTVWLSAGERRSTYVVTNTITTSEGRTEERSITIRVEDR